MRISNPPLSGKEGKMMTELLKRANEIKDELVSWRRTIHQNPELGLELPQTSAFVQKQLDEMGISYTTIVNGSGVLAQLGPKEGKCFMLRSDMDALPIQEETGLPFASCNAGKMHACGHDLHTAILLGAAKLLKERESELRGPVKLLFQPGEEIFAGGKACVEEGVLENPKVEAAFAMHVSPQVPTGIIATGIEAMSSVFGFKIEISGKGGHGSTPNICIDPINVGVHIHLALQELISRECTPLSHTALTIGQFQAGDVPNVIPQRCVMSGTLRTFDPKVTAFMIQRINEVVPSVAATYRATATVTELYNVPAVLCNKELNEFFTSAIQEAEPQVKFVHSMHAMGSEDFAFISEKIPASYFALGCAVVEPSKAVGPHNPKTVFDENCLPLGAAGYAAAALSWSKANN